MDETSRTAGAARWWGLVAVSLGVAMIIVDATIVNVAVPSIIDDLGATATDAQWIQEAYTLVFAALLLIAGRTADRSGRRRLFLVGVVVFVLASVLCAVVDSPGALIAGRALQGVGGAMILPTSLALLNANFSGRERGIAFAVWGSTIGGTAALGPLLGGWLTTDLSWRWAFGVNVPIGVLVCAGVLLWVRESREPGAAGGIDLPGTLLSVIGFAGLVFGLIEGRTYGWLATRGTVSLFGLDWTWGVSPVAVAFAVGIAALVLFVVVELRRAAAGRPVLLDLTLFGIASFRNGNAVAAVVSLGEFGLLFSLPLWLQNVLGYSALRTGVVLLALAVGSFVASGLGAVLSERLGPVATVRLGITLELLGVAGIGLVAATDTAWWEIAVALFVYGLGVGLATAQITGVVLADVPVAVSGQASGIQSTVRQLGSALGIAVLGTVLFSTLTSRLDSDLAGTLPPEQRTTLVSAVGDSAGAAIPALAAQPQTLPVAEAARDALSEATRWSAWAAAAFLLVGLVASVRLGGGRPVSPAPAAPAARRST